MSYKEKMLLQLQPFQRKSKIFEEIFRVEGSEFESLENNIDDMKKQFLVDTATWGLAIYEKELGIPIELGKPISQRRAVVKARLRGTGKVDAALLKMIAGEFVVGDVQVEFNGKIKVNLLGIPQNIQDMEHAIEEIKPAHLDVIYVVPTNKYLNLYLGSGIYLANNIKINSVVNVEQKQFNIYTGCFVQVVNKIIIEGGS